MICRFFFIFFLTLGQLHAQLTLRVVSVPSNTPVDATLYVAGNFQGWDPGNPAYQLTPDNDDTWSITFTPTPGALEFKFTRGDWSSVEGNANGGFRPNRTFHYDGNPATLELDILSWEDLGGTGTSTAAPNVLLLDQDFFMPQLDRSRRIWIYLPPDYESSQKYYPVIYMHDGQNLFDQQTSFAGEWKVDESLNELFVQGDYGAIVVGIENGGALRTDEYAPWYNTTYDAGGEGAQYMDFIVQTLKPFVDTNYRTLTEREYTCLFGSSLGALISHYGLIQHQDVFGKAGVFSPAFWFNPEIFNHSETTPKTAPMKIYMLAGTNEGNGSVMADVNQMEATLLNNNFSPNEINTAFHTDGEHSEWYWAREFPQAYLWLFDGLNISAASQTQAASIRIYPNPADTMLFLDNMPSPKKPRYRLYSLDGHLVKKEKLKGNTIDVSSLQPGCYILQIQAKRKFIFTRKIVIH